MVLSQSAEAQPAANARPQGGVVAAGAATISQTASNTAITQSSQRAAVNWNSFNVGSQQSVTFAQPSSTAVTLNTVVGPDPSRIAGKITANGQIIIENQSGVVFYKGSQVDAAGLIVSAPAVTVPNFMAGKLVFDQAARPNASVVNQGHITIKDAGLAALVAPHVVNSGTITAKLGTVSLAGATVATVDLYGDGLVSIGVQGAVTRVPADADGTPVRALVTNTGVIQARGGTVQLSAAAVDGLVTNLVTAGGRISARSAAARTGSVVIDGVGGSVTIEGTLAAAGKAPGTTGGTVQVNATNGVTLAAGSKINVSGSAGGGTVAIGTTLARAKGGPSVIGQPTAKTVAIAAGATITANATATGNGGGVTVLSARNTAMAGTITAKGGARAGDGGFVEVSGQGGYALTGVVDVSAPHGKLGTILLDPANLEIINAASGDQDTNLTGGTIVAGGADTANDQVSNAEIDSLSGNIVLQATNTLKLAANTPITLQNNASLTLETLTGAITTGSGSRITASGTGAVTMLAGTIGSGATIALGSDLITDPASGAITLKADAGIGLGAVTLRTGLLDLSTLSSGGVTQSGAGVINAGTLQSSAGVHGTVTLSGTNTIGTIGTFEVTDGSFTMVDGASLIVAGPLITDTDITLQSPTITASGTLGAGGTLTLTAGSGGITDGGTGTITAGSLSGSTAGGVVLDDGFHSIGTIAGFSAASGFSLTTTGGLSVSGTVDAGIGNLSLNAAGGDIDLGGAGGISGYLNAGSVAGSQSVTLTASGGITEYNNSQITTGTLAGSAGGNVGLTHYNDIGSVGPFTSTGMFTLNDPNNTLILQGLTATTATIVAGSIDFAGSVNAGNGLDLTASTGAIIESSGSLTTGILSGSATGSVSLNSSGNTIAAINGFTASGDFNLANQGGLQISNSLHGNNITVSSGTIRVAAPILSPGAIQLVADGNIVVASTVSAGVKLGLAVRNHGSLILGDGVANAGTLVAGSGHTISVNTDTLVAGAGAFGGIVDAGAGVFEIAPQTPGFALSFGSGASGGTLGVPSGLAISAGTLRLGEALGAITAASIDIASGLSLGLAATLDLRTTGGVTQSAGTITAGSLTGSAAGDVSLTLPNSIASVGSFTVGAGDFSLTDTGNLGIAGPLTAANISLSSPTITATGSLGATGILTLTAGSGGIALNTGEILSGATVDLSASGGGVTQAASGVITATMLQSTSGVTGTVNLAGSANAIAGVGSFAVTSGDFGLFDAGALNMAGRVSAANIALDASTISIGGTLNATTSVALGAGAGGISETGSINAGTLTSIGTIIGGATLTGSNAIAALGTVFVSGGDFSLTDSGSLSVAGLVSGPNVVLSAGTIDIAGRLNAVTSVSLTAASGALTESTGNIITPILTGSAGTSASLNGGNTIATLGSFSANGGVSLSDSRDLSVIGPVSSAAGTVVINDGTAALTLPGAISAQAATLTAGSITIAGTLIAAGTASLGALSGGVQETGTIIAGTLVSGATRFGTVNLAGTANAIAGIGSFAVAGGDFLLTDTGLVSVAGPLTAQNISINAGSISVPGSIGAAGSLAALTGTAGIDVSGTINANAGTIGLNTGLAGAITLSGSLGALALIDLIAGGGITQTAGSLVAGTIDITAPGGVSAANGHILSTGGTIAFATPNGLVNAGETITAADISFSGNVTQASASFVIASQDISVAGLLTEGGGKMTAGRNIFLGGLDQTGGGIFAGATLSIGTGSGTAGWAGSTASGGSFSQTGGTLASAGAVNIFDLGQFSQTGGTIVAGGTLGITANTAAIPGAGITIAGTIAAGGGTSGFMLLASAGDAVLETSGLLGGPALTVNGDIIPGNALQAPAGTVRIAAGTGTQGFGQYSGANPINVTGAIPAVLVGGTIDIERPIGAATLGLYAQSLIGQGQSGSITATTLTGSAGVPSNGAWAAGLTSLQWTSAGSLGWATGSVGRVALNGTNPAGTAINTIGTLADFAATGDFLLADAAAMTVAPGANVVSSAGNLYIQNG
jgi:filamentous hemagglutinin family protein